MSSVFIAVQCFQCSTMQVKQRKKSSNKWNCVVCNEKQSVRKVFFQGFMAKDVRKFVQSFNMSRHYIEQQQQQQQQEELPEETSNQNQPRSDWSEYLDPHINDFGVGDDEREPNVVTELPKPLFKKPKLRNDYSAAAAAAGEELLRPVFRKRNVTKNKVENSGEEPGAIVKGNFTRVGGNQHNHDTVEGSNSMMTNVMKPNSKRNSFDDDDDDVDRGFTDAGSSSVMVKLKRPVSKWNNFIHDGDADEWQFESRCEEINHAAFETKVNDEMVEDDVHPDFM